MKSTTRYLAALSAAAATGAVISLAPAALGATGSASAPEPTPHMAVAANPTSPDPAPVQPTGGDPQVPFGTNLNPDVNNFDGNSLAY